MDDLDAKLALADGKTDCTCNVAAHSSDPKEHDPYCAFRVLHEAAAKIARLRAPPTYAQGVEAGLDAAAMWAANNVEGNSFYVAASIRALRPPAAPADTSITQEDLRTPMTDFNRLRAERPWGYMTADEIKAAKSCIGIPPLSASAPAGTQEVTRRIAADLAPELDRLITAHIDGGMMLGSSQRTELEGFLWNDKVGILRILQAHAAAPAGAWPSEEDKQLAEVDALVAVFAFQIDPSPPDTWPKDSILSKAIQRHSARLMALYQRGKE